MSTLPLERFGSVGLDELVSEAELLTRVDRKYVLRLDEALGLLDHLDPRTRVLTIDGRRRFHYESVYFDTPDLVSYRQAATGRRRRFKVRTRSYLDSRQAFLEVKARGPREVTVKERIGYDMAARDHLTQTGRDYTARTLSGQGLDAGLADELAPALTTRYTRATLLPPETGVRVTIDTDLAWSDGERELGIPDLVIVETKAGSRPSGIDRLLWRLGHRPDSVSKYGTCLAALRDDLPSNKWARILRHHFTTEETARAA
ncbi:MAG: polyphosphate polymerase domain-containing protein [Propionicimonas sp.]|nr:polyphosphate polymerase domain-containing protein [Propionicimonas sp.]